MTFVVAMKITQSKIYMIFIIYEDEEGYKTKMDMDYSVPEEQLMLYRNSGSAERTIAGKTFQLLLWSLDISMDSSISSLLSLSVS